MNFTELVDHMNEASRFDTRLAEIEPHLPVSYSRIAEIWGYSLSDKITDSGKQQRQEFGDLLNEMRDQGMLIEKHGKFYTPDMLKPKPMPKVLKNSKRSADKGYSATGVVHVFNGKVTFESLDDDMPTLTLSADVSKDVLDGSIATVTLSDDFTAVASVDAVHGNMSDDNALGKMTALNIGISLEFPKDVLDDTPTLDIPQPSPGFRLDMRKHPFITIDPETAKDFDDAICVRQTKNGWKVMVAIADVSHYVKPGTKLAEEALKRGNSTYLPDMVIPMLPEELSNEVCSLKPNEDRAVMVCTMNIDKEGNITKWGWDRALIKSRHRLTYEEVQKAIEGDRSHLPRNVWGYISPALEVYNARLKDKKRRGALDINSAEQRVSIGRGRDVGLALEVGNEAHGVIEELMIAANVCAMKTIKAKTDHYIKRVHGTPKEEVYNAYREPLEKIGIKVPRKGDLKARIKHILNQAPSCEDPLLAYVYVTKMQDQASYSTDDLGHYGLALDDYSHETSPIRRGTDLIVHYLLNEVMGLQGGYTMPEEWKDRLPKLADHFTMTERRSETAERETQNRYMAMWVKQNMDSIFEGKVTHVNGKQLWVQVDQQDLSIRTSIKKDDLPRPLYQYKSGDKIALQPVKANMVTGVIEFKGVMSSPTVGDDNIASFGMPLPK